MIRHYFWGGRGIIFIVIEMQHQFRIAINAAPHCAERSKVVGVRFGIINTICKVVGKIAVGVETDERGTSHLFAAPDAGVNAVAIGSLTVWSIGKLRHARP